jgi:Flp pilus assembly pilin Flp
MRKHLVELWQDDAGIVALEYMLLATIVGLGLTVGLAAVNGSFNAEYTELANAVQSLDQSYSFAGHALACPQTNVQTGLGITNGQGGRFSTSNNGGLAARRGSFALDAPSSIGLRPTPAVGQNVNAGICP